MRVLVVEDNSDLGCQLAHGLREHSFTVDLTASGRDGFELAVARKYDLLILDRMLPEMDGVQLLSRLRNRRVTTPAIFLTARVSVHERVEGLNAGADDYLIKPFSFAELLARINAVLRRGQDVSPPVLQVADLTLDPFTRTVKRSARSIDLSAKQFAMLDYLMRHAGQVVSRTMILEHVWDFSFDGLSNVVDVHINRLRKAIDLSSDEPLIHTLRGVGYVLREK